MPDTKCFAHDHMTCAEYGLWTMGRELSYKKNLLFFDGRNMAKRFRRGGRTAMYKLMHQLIEAGWFVLVEPSKRKPNGQWSATVLRVLPHDEWAKEHPKSCKIEAENEEAPVPILNSACPESAMQPVPKSGHSLVYPFSSGVHLQTGDNLVKSACPEIGNGDRAFVEGPTSPKKSKTETGVTLVCVASPENGTGPVPKTGQDGLKTDSPENLTVSPPAPKRRTREQLTPIAAAKGITIDALLAAGVFELIA